MKPTNEPAEKSEFNIAVASLYRINDILTTCAVESSSRNFFRWGNLLFALCREFSYMFNKEENEEDKKFKNTIHPLITEFEKRMEWDQSKRHYSMIDKFTPYPNYTILYRILEKYEKFLRNALYRRDMLSVQKADTSKAVSSMN